MYLDIMTQQECFKNFDTYKEMYSIEIHMFSSRI